MCAAPTNRLKQALPAGVRALCDRLRAKGYRAWIVGGCVRDLLLEELRGAVPGALAVRGDWDIATDARPEQVRRCFQRVIPTGIQHGTVTVLLDGVGYEVTTLRGETSYSDGRHPDRVYFVDDIEADLARRDFTINAMAYDPTCNALIDPFGGAADLQTATLRAVGDPAERFAEDGLRVLRAARFVATLQVTLDRATQDAIRPSLDSYRRVSPERIRDEWTKTLAAPAPSCAFEIMRTCGLLEITAPELAPAGDRPPVADLRAWEYRLACVDECPARLVVRLAALLQDWKSATRAAERPGGDGSHPAGSRLGEQASAVLKRLRFSNRDQTEVVALVRELDVEYNESWEDRDVRRWVRRVGPARLTDLLDLASAVARVDLEPGAPPAERLTALRRRAQRELEQGAPLSTRDLAVDGNDLMSELGLRPGRQVGELLEQLLEAALDDPAVNDREQLLELARRLVAR